MQIPVVCKDDSGNEPCIVLLDISEILYVSRDHSDRIHIHTRERTYYNLHSLDDFELFLSKHDFYRTDRVCIVNMSSVKKMDEDLGLVFFEDPPRKHAKFATVAYNKLRKVRDWIQKRS
jgi:Response regulator of the LytR/AlgR family